MSTEAKVTERVVPEEADAGVGNPEYIRGSLELSGGKKGHRARCRLEAQKDQKMLE